MNKPTQADEEYIQKSEGKLTVRQCAEYLGLTKSQVEYLRTKLGLVKSPEATNTNTNTTENIERAQDFALKLATAKATRRENCTEAKRVVDIARKRFGMDKYQYGNSKALIIRRLNRQAELSNLEPGVDYATISGLRLPLNQIAEVFQS